MGNENVLNKKTLQEIADLTKKLNFSMIASSIFQRISLAHNLLSSWPIDYLQKVGTMQAEIAKAYKQINPQPLFKAIANLQKPFVDQISSVTITMHKAMQYATKTIQEADEILLNLGWWIYPDWAIPSLNNIIKAHKAGKDGEIEKEILKYFDEKKLDEMEENWKSNSKLSHRMPILEQAVWAHKQGKYILSILALLTNVEGIINENSGRKGYIKHEECLSILIDYVNKKIKTGSLYSLYPLAILKFAASLLRERFEWGKQSKKGRHPILHGHYVSYNDRVFSLKLILLIDFIQNLI